MAAAVAFVALAGIARGQTIVHVVPTGNNATSYDAVDPKIFVNFGGGSGYVGFSFEPAATVLYGWMYVTLNNDTSTMTVNSWAYNSTGAGIQAGAIPEPAGTAAVMAAAAMLCRAASALRRQRRPQALLV